MNKTRTTVGTPGYEAPEVLEGRPYCPKAYDIFSSGVCLFIMTFGFPPFKEAKKTDKNYRYFYYNKENEYWSRLSNKINPSKEIKKLLMIVLNMIQRREFL